MWSLGHTYHAGCFVLQLCSSAKLQAQAEHIIDYPTYLVGAGLQGPGADAIRTCSLPRLNPPENLGSF